MLTGPELIKLVKANPEANRSQLAKLAGYVSVSEKDGKERLLLMKFQDALLEAHGTTIKKGNPGAGGKAARYETTVHASGVLLIGKTYTQEFSAEPGDTFGIEVREDGIWLPLLERDAEARAKVATKAAERAQKRKEKAAAQAQPAPAAAA